MGKSQPSQWRNRIIGHGEEAPDQLLANPSQWKIHPKYQQDAIAGVLSDVGWVQSVIVNQNTQHLLDGHARVAIAISRNEPSVPVVYVDVSEDEERLILATIDPLSAMAVADKEQLDALLREVSSSDSAVQAMLAELAKESGLDYGKEKAEAPEPQIDKAAELQEKWQTALGQLWEIPSKSVMGKCHRLLCGDSTKAEDVAKLTNGRSYGTLVFDPPYDAERSILDVRYPANDVIVFTDHRHLLDCVQGWGQYRCCFVWDCVTSWYVPSWPLARGKFALWFGNGTYNPDGAHYGDPDKAHEVSNTRGSYHYVPDPRGKHLSTVFQKPITKEFDGHAHAKPVEWLKMLIANCTSGEVLDLFLGSGTTLIACEQLGRTCAGLELDPATLAVTLERADEYGLSARLSNAA